MGPWQAAGILLVAVVRAFVFWVYVKVVMVAWPKDRMVRQEEEDLRTGWAACNRANTILGDHLRATAEIGPSDP
jgi:hypothetical protein